MNVDLTAELAPIFVGLVATLTLAVGALIAMVDRRALGSDANPFIPERLFLSEVLAVATGVALFVVVIASLRW